MTWTCSSCGHRNTGEARYCTRCGLEGTNAVSPVAPTASSIEGLEDVFSDLSSGTVIFQRYQIIEKIGEGDNGKVYKALDLETSARIALKMIRPEIIAQASFLERFHEVFPVFKNAVHKNLCRYYEFKTEENFSFITMEHISGEDLKTMLRMTKRMSPGVAVDLALQICEGLAAIHALGQVHRDLKPGNIMMDKTGQIRILDSGLGGFVERDKEFEAGTLIGTPEYMSPEQRRGQHVDVRSDIYSLGVVLFEMVTGVLPFERAPLRNNILKGKQDPPDPRKFNPSVPIQLSRIIRICLSADREDRYTDLEDLKTALSAVERKMPRSNRGDSALSPRNGKLTPALFFKRLMQISALFAAVLLIRAGIFVLLNRIPSPVFQSRTKMLAVLPFENLGRNADDYFSEGLTEELTSRLAALHGLGVISRTSAAQYKNSEKTLREIGAELGVDYILEGTVRWDRNPEGRGVVRFTPKLIRVTDDTPLWSQSFDRVIEDIFSVQSEIAENVIRSLDLAVLEPERRAVEMRPTDNLEAYDNYLRARRMTGRAFETRNREDFEAAIQLLERAVQLDPYFTYAHIVLSEIHSLIYTSGIDRTMDRLEKIRNAVQRALALEPDLPDAKQALALYYYRGLMDYERALGIFEEVKRSRPNVQPAAIGYILRRQGKWQECLDTLEQSFRLSPRNAEIAFQIGRTHMCLRQYAEARIWFDRASQIEPDAFYPRLNRALLSLYASGNVKETRTLLADLPSHELVAYYSVLLDSIEGRYDSALSQLNELTFEAFEESNFYLPVDLALATVYRAQNNISSMRTHADRARILLEEKVAEHPEDPRYAMAFGKALAFLGRYSESIRESSRAVHLYPLSRDAVDAPRYVMDMALVYTLLGDDLDAVRRIESLMAYPSGDLISKPLLRIDPLWAPLHAYPAFLDLLEE